MFFQVRNFYPALLLVGLVSSNAAAIAMENNAKISLDTSAVVTSDKVNVIIQYKTDPSDLDVSRIVTASGKIQRRMHGIKAIHASIPQGSLNQLASNPNVQYVSLDRSVSAAQASSTSAEYTTEPINAPLVWAVGLDGTGIGVAVIDSGINPVADLSVKGNSSKTRIVYNQSFVPNELTQTADAFGHGTHVAGLIAGNGTDSTGKKYFRTFSGVAPNANLVNLRVLDENGEGSDSSVIAAIETAIALKDVYTIKVINLSVGRPIYETYQLDPLCQAVELAWKSGIAVVVAAGNDGRDLTMNKEGYGTIEAPGNDPYAITVGAVKTMATATVRDDQMASYSSKGPSYIDHIAKPDLVAPGNLVTSLRFPNDPLALSVDPLYQTLDKFYITNGDSNLSPNYFPLSGTSMAAGVTSGSVALLMQARPRLTPDQAKAFLMRDADRKYLPQTSVAVEPTTGISYTAHNDLFTIGAGELDIAASVADALFRSVPAGTAMSPVAAYDPTSNSVFLLKDPSSLWVTGNGTPLWGTNDVYGQAAFGNQPASGSAVWGWTPLYGASNVTGQPVVAGVAGPGAQWSATSITSTNDSSAFTALWGNGTPLWGTGTPLWGTGTPLWGTGTPLWGTSTPLWGTTTPLWGTGTPLWGTGTPLWGTGTPLWGTGTPLWGTSSTDATSTLWGTGTPLWGTGTPLWGTGTPLWGTGTPLWGTGTPLWGTSVPLEN
jgi:serine protease AprX